MFVQRFSCLNPVAPPKALASFGRRPLTIRCASLRKRDANPSAVQTSQPSTVVAEDNLFPPWDAQKNLTTSVPMSGAERTMHMPTAVWIVSVLKVVIMAVLNVSPETIRNPDQHPQVVAFNNLERRLNAIIQHQRASGVPSGTIGEVPVEVRDPPEKLDVYEELNAEIQETFSGLLSRVLNGSDEQETPTRGRLFHHREPQNTIQQYREIFRVIDLPEVAEDFETDETFARYRVAGPNPMLIKGVTKEELTRLIGHRISDQDLNDILDTTGDSLERAGIEGRLCVADYHSLSGIDNAVKGGPPFVTHPIAVFVEPLTGTEFIKPVAIQMGQNSTTSELILANTPDRHRWQIAKTVVQVADATHHELIAHLADTHLAMEAFSIATQRNLSKEHPVHKLLMPHFEGTNFINNAAASILIAPGGAIDNVFSGGSNPRHRSLQALAIDARFDFDFTNRMPDMELKSRNIDRLKVFPYRDDALLVWDAILRWSRQYVDLYYANDQAVESDAELALWSKDLGEHGDLTNFQAPQTKDVLIRTLAMIMFTTSAQHAAVNFPQRTDMTFAPAMPGAIWDTIPPQDSGNVTESQWLDLLPPMDSARTQLLLLYALGSVYYRRLGQYHSSEFPYFGTLDPAAGEALDSFRKELEAIEIIIKARNKDRGDFAYTHLLPSNIPASINI